MTQHHQTAIDLMNEITSSTDSVSRSELFDRLFNHLIEHFPVPPRPDGPKDSPEYQHWLTFVLDLRLAMTMPDGHLEDNLLKTPTEFGLPSTFAMMILKVILKVRLCPMDVSTIPSFNDFYQTYAYLVHSSGNDRI